MTTNMTKYIIFSTILVAVLVGISYSVDYVVNNYRQTECQASGGTFMRSIDADRSFCVSKGVQ